MYPGSDNGRSECRLSCVCPARLAPVRPRDSQCRSPLSSIDLVTRQSWYTHAYTRAHMHLNAPCTCTAHTHTHALKVCSSSVSCARMHARTHMHTYTHRTHIQPDSVAAGPSRTDGRTARTRHQPRLVGPPGCNPSPTNGRHMSSDVSGLRSPAG